MKCVGVDIYNKFLLFVYFLKANGIMINERKFVIFGSDCHFLIEYSSLAKENKATPINSRILFQPTTNEFYCSENSICATNINSAINNNYR